MKNANATWVRTTQVILAILLFLSTGILVVEVLLMGVLTVFGRSVDVVSAVDLILAIGRLSGSAMYRPIAELTMGGLYYGISVFMIVQIISAIKAFINCLKNVAVKERYDVSIRRLLANFGGSLTCVLLFYGVSRMVAGYGGMSDSLMHILLLGVVVHFVARLFLRLIEYRSFGYAVYEGLLCNGLFVVAWLLFCYSLRDASLYSVSQGLNVLFSSTFVGDLPTRYYVTLVYEVFFKNIMLVILMFTALNRMNEALVMEDHRKISKYVIKKPLITTIVMVCICIIMSTYLANGSIADSALNIVLEYCPMILSIVTAYVAMTIPSKAPAGSSPSTEGEEDKDAPAGA